MRRGRSSGRGLTRSVAASTSFGARRIRRGSPCDGLPRRPNDSLCAHTSPVSVVLLHHDEQPTHTAVVRRAARLPARPPARAGHPTLTALRHPIHRIVAHFFATVDEPGAPRTAGKPSATNPSEGYQLPVWIERNSAKPPRRGNDGATRLWIELDNLYVKVKRFYLLT